MRACGIMYCTIRNLPRHIARYIGYGLRSTPYYLSTQLKEANFDTVLEAFQTRKIKTVFMARIEKYPPLNAGS